MSEEEEALRQIQERLDALDKYLADSKEHIAKMKDALVELETELLVEEIYDHLED